MSYINIRGYADETAISVRSDRHLMPHDKEPLLPAHGQKKNMHTAHSPHGEELALAAEAHPLLILGHPPRAVKPTGRVQKVRTAHMLPFSNSGSGKKRNPSKPSSPTAFFTTMFSRTYDNI